MKMDGFEWDEDKRLSNIEDHGVDFRFAVRVFENPVIEAEDGRSDYGEIRIRALGRVDDDYFVVVYTLRNNNRRLISVWKAGKNGKRRYQTILDGRT